MKREDFVGDPCTCPECVQAGVSTQELRRDYQTGRWLHGYALKRWYEALDEARAAMRAAVNKMAMPK
jgi:hypothetical protein